MSTLESFIPEKTQFKSLINKLVNLPLWVKQSIYCELKSNLAECSDIQLLDNLEINIIQLFKPRLTAIALRLLRKQDKISNLSRLDPNQIQFMEALNNDLTLLEIAHKNNCTLKETCNILLSLIDESMVEPFENKNTLNFVLYITDRIRLGEFLVRTNRLTIEQLDKALFSRKYSESIGEILSFGDTLTNLGYLKPKQIENITSIKASSEQKISVLDESEAQAQEIIALQDEIDSLQFRNKKITEELLASKKELELKNLEILDLTKQLEKYSKGFMTRFLTSLT